MIVLEVRIFGTKVFEVEVLKAGMFEAKNH